MKMTRHFVISAVWAGTVFGPHLWQLSARRHSLAEYDPPPSDFQAFQRPWFVLVWFNSIASRFLGGPLCIFGGNFMGICPSGSLGKCFLPHFNNGHLVFDYM